MCALKLLETPITAARDARLTVNAHGRPDRTTAHSWPWISQCTVEYEYAGMCEDMCTVCGGVFLYKFITIGILIWIRA